MNSYFSLSAKDAHELEVRDAQDALHLHIRFLNENSFWIEGRFLIPGRGMLVASSDHILHPDGTIVSGGCTFGGHPNAGTFYFD